VVCLLGSVAWTLGLARSAAAVGAGEEASPPARLEYQRDVRPILANHCFKCHGPDENTRKAELRLDLREAALEPARSGNAAIVPGQVERSELVRRILTDDADDRMPPDATKRPLSEPQKRILTQWVAGGAEYQPHWAFAPPVRHPVPPVRRPDWPRNEIDHFILARLEQEGLSPSPQADRPALVRRLYLDLIGLPPTPEEAAAFVSDTAADGYERLVDRLLASPHYGERWARRWLDLARYADTNGYEKDRPRSIWPWRDWVIAALNADLPFDRFTIEQLAGDLLPDATAAQRIATGFHRNTMLNEEGGIDPREYHFYAVVDRANTTATTWLGLTMSCARCHTHKYDPITQREYYQFLAFLNNTEDLTLDVPDAEVARRRQEQEGHIATLEASLAERFPAPITWRWDTAAAVRFATESGAVAERLNDHSFRVEGVRPDKDVYTVTLSTSLTNVTLVRLEVLPDAALPRGGPGRADDGGFVLSEVEITAGPPDGSAPPQALRVARAEADFAAEGSPIAHARDGKTETGWSTGPAEKGTGPRTATFTLDPGLGGGAGTSLRVRLSQQAGERRTLGRFRLSLAEAVPDGRPLEVRRREHLEQQFGAWSLRERERLVRWTALRPTAVSSTLPRLTVQPDGSVRVTGDQNKSDTYELRFQPDLRGLTALRLEVLPDDRLPLGGPGRVSFEGPLGDFFLSTFSVTADGSPVLLSTASSSYASGAHTASKAIDSDPQSGWSIDGGQGRRHTAVFNLAAPLTHATDLAVTMLFEKHYPAGLGRFRLWATTDTRVALATPMPDDVQTALALDDAQRTGEQRQALLRYFLSVAPELAQERETIHQLRRALPRLSTTLVFEERPPDHPRPTFVQRRGEFLQPAEQVEPGVPAVLPDLPAGVPRNRLELARWLVSPSNPLTARVTVNRQWAAFFGRGLVSTIEDFGFQGALPSHPELLDWLAVEFREQGWSLKRLHRRLVTSATYRQATTVTPALRERDPENRLLARAPRIRLEAEAVRDVALRASGLLASRLGGPSVFPPQPPGITREGTYGPLAWSVSEGEDRYRRGLYTFAKRTAPYATFNTFDAPSGEACVAQREVSNTPLQALTLLNDTAFVEAAQALGRLAAGHAGSDETRASLLFRRCLTRSPEPLEIQQLLTFYRSQKQRLEAGELPAAELAGSTRGDAIETAAWTAVARVLLNLDETITKG